MILLSYIPDKYPEKVLTHIYSGRRTRNFTMQHLTALYKLMYYCIYGAVLVNDVVLYIQSYTCSLSLSSSHGKMFAQKLSPNCYMHLHYTELNKGIWTKAQTQNSSTGLKL